MKKFLIVLVCLLASAGFLFAQAAEEAVDEVVMDTGRTGGEFVINNGAEPESIDPHLVEGVPEHAIYMSLFEGLTTYDPETALAVPGIAESWDVSDDGMTYTFHLREAFWTDGVKITAQQFVDSWLRGLDPATGSPYAWFPSMFIEGAAAYNGGEAEAETVQIRALDEMTFQIDLIGPLPYVLDALPHYAFAVVPLHAIEKFGEEWILPENLVCNGPFILEEWKPQEYLSVVPNDKYWDAGAVNLDRVVYLPIDDSNTAHNMYLNGEADWNGTVPLDQMDAVKLRDDYHNAPYLGTYYYLFETTTPPTDDVRVRKALAMAIDRQSLVDLITKGGQLPAYGMVPGMAGFPMRQHFEEDAEAARALLADAGYPNGQGWPEGIQILYNTSEGHKKIGEYIQQQWKENLGIDVELINMEWGTYFKNRRTHDFVISRAGWIGDYPDPNTMLDMFITGGGGNDGQYSNAGFDAAINKAARMEPGTARYDVLREAEDYFIGEDMGVMPIYFFTSNNLIDLDVWGGWYVNVMDYHPTKDIYLK